MKTTLELWKRFWRLSNFGRMIAFQSIGALIAIKVGLFLFGLRPWKHKIATIASAVTPPPSPAIGPEHVATAQEIAQIVSLVARNLFFSSNCLEGIGGCLRFLRCQSTTSFLRSTLLGGAGWHRADFAEARTLDVRLETSGGGSDVQGPTAGCERPIGSRG